MFLFLQRLEKLIIRARALHFLHKKRPVSDTDTSLLQLTKIKVFFYSAHVHHLYLTSLLKLIKFEVFDAFNAATDSTVKTF